MSHADGTASDAKLRLALRWEERGCPQVTPPVRRGFGSRMIEREFAAEVGGEVRMIYAPAGVVCTIEMPLEMG